MQKEILPFFYKEDGTLVINACCSSANDDWLRSARLKKAADKGDKKAKAKLEKMYNTPMMQEVADDE